MMITTASAVFDCVTFALHYLFIHMCKDFDNSYLSKD